MRNIIILIIIFLVSTVGHWAFAAAGAEFNVGVNFMLTAGAAACCFYPKWAGYTFMFFGGLFLDFFGVNMFGVYAFTFTLCAAAVYAAKNSLDFEAPLPQAALVFCLSVFAILVYNTAGIIFLKGIAWNGFFSLISGAVINALLAPFIFYIFKELQNIPAEK